MKRAIIISVFCLMGIQARATTTFTITAADLQLANGTLMPTSGLVLLVVSTTDSIFQFDSDPFNFNAPLALNSFLSGDDLIIGRWNLSGSGSAGVLIDITSPIVYQNNISQGDLLRLYWFPTLTLDSTITGAGTSFGTYRDPATDPMMTRDGSALWSMPADTGALLDLKFITMSQGGSNPDASGRAVFMTVPEPSTYALVGLGLMGWLGLSRRRKAK